jgi:hypothetical protein
MTPKIILAHYVNTADKSRTAAIEEYHSIKRQHEQLKEQTGNGIMTYVIMSETKPTSIECIYPVVSVTSDEDYIELIKRLDAIVDRQKSLFYSCK